MSPDFTRRVYCLLGLPFDAIDLAGAVDHLRAAARNQTRCFVSTPNVNFLATASQDAEFRDAVLRSDLSLIDSMPLVWIARLLGLPLRTRVAGSELFEWLRNCTGAPLKVFFFGGEEGIAAKACARLNAYPCGLRCVGCESPGFGSVEAISSAAQLQRINASGADFVVVSLGARKGQAWIERNRRALRAPLISHLGAVVNFVAGTVRRAPVWLQRCGMEWLWRILEEPVLWRRYASDAVVFSGLLWACVIPYMVHVRWRLPSAADSAAAQASLHDAKGGSVLRLEGPWTAANADRLQGPFARVSTSEQPVIIDLADVTFVDCAFIGLLSLLWIQQHDAGRPLQVKAQRPAVQKVFAYCNAEYLLCRSGSANTKPTIAQTGASRS